ncbi:MAG: short-chain dehydrogenase/reductase [Marmoricola sp.]|nr:short-chain dehydrogenase/reductase [Marmoricola sp.]
MTNPLMNGPKSLARRARRSLPGSKVDSPLKGKRILITGASSGIGAESARKVAARGAITLLVARRADELDAVAGEIRAAGGVAHTYVCDLSNFDDLDDLVGKVIAEHGGLDMLVNNAGRSIRRSIKYSYDRMHDYERTMAINYFAPVRLSMGFLPAMVDQGDGHIVNVVSEGLQVHTPKFSAYLSSKAALDMWGRIAGREYFHDGVTVTSVRMPLVRTDMIAATDAYRRMPVLAPDEAAAMVVHALEDRPVVVNKVLGVAMSAFSASMPRVSDALVATAARRMPNSKAAKLHVGDDD